MISYEEQNGEIVQQNDEEDDQNYMKNSGETGSLTPTSSTNRICVQRRTNANTSEIKTEINDDIVKTSHQNGDIPGQATKDILKRPRPLSPPVIKLEARYELEYGMPSTHAMVGTCIPFTMLFIAATRYEFPFLIGLFLALTWTMLVSLSRIYLGMHSVLDVIVGILCVCLLFPLLFPFLNDFDHFSVTHPLAPIFTIGIPFIMCICYPPVDKWNTARRDTTLLVGVAAGISVGSWLSYQYGLAVESPPTPYGIYLPTLMTVGLSFLRLLVGVPLMLLTGELLRPIVRRIISHILQMDLQDPQIKKMQIYELTDSFIPFLFVAINVTFGIPLIFKLLSIDRPEYYTELLAAPTE
ncbi:SGPP1 [Acanthosepion pharaonis]|uniref:SGPP1 n=1 Tax=Acanthosepion pharaonis TaxID=158019 RepID=A0A812C5R4_ACAPH|nr:SGPP1 [Sepia pharaonis]